MEKVKVVVLRPWLDGQKAGDVITLTKIHPSLKTHVRLLNEAVTENPDDKEQDKKPKPDGENPNPDSEVPKADSKRADKSDKK